jgi:hypothetical protein
MVDLAVERGLIHPDDQNTLLKWRENPAEWGRIS